MSKQFLQDDYGRVVNLSRALYAERIRNSIKYHFDQGWSYTVDYETIANAKTQYDKITAALTGDTNLLTITDLGSPTISSVTPNAWGSIDHLEFVVVGTFFYPSGRITIQGNDYTKQFVDSTKILCQHPNSPPLGAGGPYDVIYLDDAGRTVTAAAAVTIT